MTPSPPALFLWTVSPFLRHPYTPTLLQITTLFGFAPRLPSNPSSLTAFFLLPFETCNLPPPHDCPCAMVALLSSPSACPLFFFIKIFHSPSRRPRLSSDGCTPPWWCPTTPFPCFSTLQVVSFAPLPHVFCFVQFMPYLFFIVQRGVASDWADSCFKCFFWKHH